MPIGKSTNSSELQDTSGTEINPATEDKQDDLIASSNLVKQADPNNTTTIPLVADDTWEGDWTEVLGFSSVYVEISSDQASAANGFKYQTSDDGITVRHTESQSVNAGIDHHYTFQLTNSYYRIRYTNGTTGQGSFRIGSTLSKQPVVPQHAHGLEIEIDSDHSAILTKSVVSGLNPLGEYVNVPTTAGSALIVATTDVFRGVTNKNLANFTGTTTTLSAAATSQDTSIDIQAGDYASFLVNDYIEIKDGTVEEGNFVKITAKPGSPTLTLDRPLDNSYSNGSSVEKVILNLVSAAGSLASPVIYRYTPPANKIIKGTYLTLTMEDSTAMDLSTFGGMAALTNGALARIRFSGTYITTAIYPTNNHFVQSSTTLPGNMFHDRAPAGKFGMAVEWEVSRILEAPPVLNGFIGDFFEILIQDDVTPVDMSELRFHGVTLN